MSPQLCIGAVRGKGDHQLISTCCVSGTVLGSEETGKMRENDSAPHRTCIVCGEEPESKKEKNTK